MDTTTLGSNGLTVSAQGLGCMGMSHGYGPGDESESLTVLRRAFELGVNFWDTADYYAAGANEVLLAKMLHQHRDQVVLATKFGLLTAPDPASSPAVRGDAQYVRRACEASLRRLGTDVIDLYYQHRIDVPVPIEETVDAMAALVTAGKVRHLATCRELGVGFVPYSPLGPRISRRNSG